MKVWPGRRPNACKAPERAVWIVVGLSLGIFNSDPFNKAQLLSFIGFGGFCHFLFAFNYVLYLTSTPTLPARGRE